MQKWYKCNLYHKRFKTQQPRLKWRNVPEKQQTVRRRDLIAWFQVKKECGRNFQLELVIWFTAIKQERLIDKSNTPLKWFFGKRKKKTCSSSCSVFLCMKKERVWCTMPLFILYSKPTAYASFSYLFHSALRNQLMTVMGYKVLSVHVYLPQSFVCLQKSRSHYAGGHQTQ